jgi:hypothetical protein
VTNSTTTLEELELYEVSEQGQVAAGTDGNIQRAPMPPWLGDRAVTKPDQHQAVGEVDANGHRVILVDGETLTVVEGDVLLDIDQKQLWQEALAARQAEQQTRLRVQQAGLAEVSLNQLSGIASSSLVGIVQDDKLVRWSPGTVLTYCVLKNTFPREEWYEEVVTNMEMATEAWQATCGVEFEYIPNLDSSASMRPDGVLFPVRHIGAGGAFVAASFFPNDIASRRRLLIDPSYFTTTFNHVGVLRHELGHIIGFRHEHIRSGAPPICPHEDITGTINLTDYDPQSVMHYFCGGVGSRDLQITQIDRMGAQQVYGPPLSAFELAEA